MNHSSETIKNFDSLPLRPEVLTGLASVNYVQMSPVQSATVNLILEGRDLLAQAETGSGKTAAFAVGLLNKLDATLFKTQALLICPTRELSDQVAAEIQRLASSLPNTRVLTLCGGNPIQDQITSLKREPHIVVGTPGRLKKHLEKGTLRMGSIQTLILDEADRMLEMGFYDDILSILNQTPNNRQTLLFSATYPDAIVGISRAIQNNPAEVRLEITNTAQHIKQVFVSLTEAEKPQALLQALGKYQPGNAIIFCNRKIHAQSLCDSLRDKGIRARALHGDLDQRERDEAIILFANKSISFLIATDVAARGLDISALSAVINYDLTPDPETHVHRIGRTGRAGMEGIAISFVTDNEMSRLRAIEENSDLTATFEQLHESDRDDAQFSTPPTQTIQLSAGKKDKIRPGDIVGALTANTDLTNDDLGKITVRAKVSFVAVNHDKANLAMKILSEERIKRQKVRSRLLMG